MRPRSIALTALLALAGCTSATGEPAEAGTAALEGSVGVLRVERSSADVGGARAVVSAAFARYRGLSASDVGLLLGSPSLDAASVAELESCAFVSAEAPMALVDGSDLVGAQVELMDAGAIHVRVDGTDARLSARTFPDLASVLTGVFYAGDVTTAALSGGPPVYALSAEGSAELAPFEIAIRAPADPVGVRLGGVEAERVVIARDDGAQVTWEARDARDVIELDFVAGRETLTCAASDDGSFEVSAAALATLSADEDAELIVRRVHVSSFDMRDVDAAFVRAASVRRHRITVR